MLLSRLLPPLEPARSGFAYKALKSRKIALLYHDFPDYTHPKQSKFIRDVVAKKNQNVYLEEELLNMPSSGKPLYRSIGPLTDYRPVAVDQSVGNHYRGIRKRVAHQVMFSQKRLDQFRSFVDDYVRKHYTPLPYIELDHDFLDTWLDNSHYTQKQKVGLHQELSNYLKGEYSEHKLFRLNSFIKKEFYEGFKEPRIINAPSDMMKTVVGPYIHAIEQQVYDDHFIKHKTPTEVANILREKMNGYSLVYETDYSSFEGTITREIMRVCELVLFKRMLLNNKKIYKIIKRCDVAKRDLYFRNGVAHAVLSGSRMSGALWTSLGNGFTNKMLVEFTAWITRKKIGQSMFRKASFQYDYLVEGDDGFIVTSRKFNWKVAQQLGFRLKCDEAHEINDVSFCGICIAPCGLMPDLPRIMHKFGYTFDEYLVRASNPDSKKFRRREQEMLRSKAMSLLATSKGVPILQPLALKLMDLTKGAYARKKDFDWWELNVLDILKESMKPTSITTDMRVFVENKYGITVDKQIKIEEAINAMVTPYVRISL